MFAHSLALLMRFGMGELLSQVLTQLSVREEPKLQKVLQYGKRIHKMKSYLIFDIGNLF